MTGEQWVRECIATSNLWTHPTVIDTAAIEFEALVASGGSGVVYKAVEKSTGNVYAVKLAGAWENAEWIDKQLEQIDAGKKRAYKRIPALTKNTFQNASRQENLIAYKQREVRNHVKVLRQGHTNIVKLFAFADTPGIRAGNGYITFSEFCDAGSLQSLVDRFKARNFFVPEHPGWKVYKSLLRAVAWLHKDPVPGEDTDDLDSRPVLIHGDINLPNVLLSFQGLQDSDKGWPIVKLADLDGAVALWDDREQYELTFGKPDSDPPETPTRSKAADIWGIGATMHALLHRGACPIEDDQPAHADRWGDSRNGRQAWTLPPNYTAKIEEVVGMALRMDADQRPSAGTLLYKANASFRSMGQAGYHKRQAPSWIAIDLFKKFDRRHDENDQETEDEAGAFGTQSTSRENPPSTSRHSDSEEQASPADDNNSSPRGPDRPKTKGKGGGANKGKGDGKAPAPANPKKRPTPADDEEDREAASKQPAKKKPKKLGKAQPPAPKRKRGEAIPEDERGGEAAQPKPKKAKAERKTSARPAQQANVRTRAAAKREQGVAGTAAA